MKFGKVFKKVGKVIVSPVTVPAKAIKQGAEKAIVTNILVGVLRHVLGAAGVGAAVVSESDLVKVVGALVTVGTIVHSVYTKWQEQKAKE